MPSPPQNDFDPQQAGLLSHYGEEARFQIKKRMCDDWRATDIKLPTYMNLVARFIEKTGIQEAWLAKLSHQTMAKMIAGTSTPRHEFWACLHMYLIKKYGPLSITPSVTDADILGQSITRFATTENMDGLAGNYPIADHTMLSLSEADDQHYAYAALKITQPASDDFYVAMTTRLEGLAVKSGNAESLLLLKNTEDSSFHYQAVRLNYAGS